MRTLGAPAGAFGSSYGDQSGLESRTSSLIVPLNFLSIESPPVLVQLRRHLEPLHACRRRHGWQMKRHGLDRSREREQAAILVVGTDRRHAVHADVHALGAAALRNLFVETHRANFLTVDRQRDLGGTTRL